MLTIKGPAELEGFPAQLRLDQQGGLGVVCHKAQVACVVISQCFPTGVSNCCHKWVVGWKKMSVIPRVFRRSKIAHVRKECLLGKYYFTQVCHAVISSVL